MLQDAVIVRKRHKRFVKTTSDELIVYSLKSPEGFATSSSNNYEDKHDELISLICFWSEEALAKSCIRNSWTEYEVTEIDLNEFLEN